MIIFDLILKIFQQILLNIFAYKSFIYLLKYFNTFQFLQKKPKNQKLMIKADNFNLSVANLNHVTIFRAFRKL